tara:strand:+ start:227 stop:814 length:588 start_codon:yes stop_codon:yes gene_type:complete
MKHAHYDKIVAKAENMNLVVFSYCNLDELWSKDVPSQPGVEFIDSSNTDYFLCLPQHKEACLHWLNGGNVQDFFNGEWVDCAPLSKTINTDSDNSLEFSYHHMFMNEEFNFRIAPKKEKRWIATFPWSGNAFYVTPESFCSEELLNNYVDMHYGKRDIMLIHEIEVEIAARSNHQVEVNEEDSNAKFYSRGNKVD